MDDRERQRLTEHLKILSICHYVYAGLATCGSALGLIYIAMGQLIASVPKWKPTIEQDPPPPEVLRMFQWMFGIFGGCMMVGALGIAALCFFSARAMSARRNRTLSLVAGGVVCVTGLFGVVLGVFTLVLLLGREAKELYDEAERGAGPAA